MRENYVEGDLLCTVASLVPFEIVESKPGLFPSIFRIPPSDTKRVQVIHVGTASHFVYLDETRGSLRVPTPATTLAKSIVNDFITSQLNVGEGCIPGLFWVPGKLDPDDIEDEFADLVEKAYTRQQRWFEAICRLADDDWTRYQKHNVISDVQRTAAKLIGWEPKEHPWMRQARDMNTKCCMGCGSPIIPNVAKCVCGVILDRQLYDSLDYGGKK